MIFDRLSRWTRCGPDVDRMWTGYFAHPVQGKLSKTKAFLTGGPDGPDKMELLREGDQNASQMKRIMIHI